MLRRLCETLLLPPASALWLLLLGTLLRRRWPRFGRAMQVFAFGWLWAASTPAVGGWLLAALQTSPALPPHGALPAADAIVVLSAEADRGGAEYGGAVVGPTTLQRLRYGAALQRRTGLPMLCSGGAPGTGLPSLAALMAQAATAEFGVPVRWREERSADTRENAAFSAELLREAGVRRVLLVTSAWHMPRAVGCFERMQIEVVAAPTGFRGPAVEDWTSFVPRWSGLRDTCLALHELGGRLAYWLGG
ncbi:MAG: YdcF family protein [Planctomycetes bacterium]|nr:YdcF family protein [Planctomycetota bacterium]